MRNHGGFSIPRGARQILSIGSSPYKFTSMHHFDWEIGGPFNFETRPGYTPDGLRLIRISGPQTVDLKNNYFIFSSFFYHQDLHFFSSALSPFHFIIRIYHFFHPHYPLVFINFMVIQFFQFLIIRIYIFSSGSVRFHVIICFIALSSGFTCFPKSSTLKLRLWGLWKCLEYSKRNTWVCDKLCVKCEILIFWAAWRFARLPSRGELTS